MLLKTKTPLVYLITNGAATGNNFSESSREILKTIRAAVEAEIALVQIREKSLNARFLFELAREAAKLTRKTKTKILINDRADVALSAGVDGVHLTANSLAAKIIRNNFPADFLIGASCHSLAEVLQAKNDDADFATFSPIFFTPNKGEPQGLENLRTVCQAAGDFPVIALGGIDETSFESVLQTGASGVAAIRLLNDVERLSGFAAKTRGFQGAR